MRRGDIVGILLPLLLVLAICGMAMYVTGQDNSCSTEIDWVGRCKP